MTQDAKNSPKDVVIIQHSPSTGVQGQLANQLWNFVSVYAYALEKNIPCRNYSFFEYSRYFNIPVGNIFIRLVFFIPFEILIKILPEHVVIPVWRKFYKLYVLAVCAVCKESFVEAHSSNNDPYYLPPSQASIEFTTREQQIRSTLFTSGWLFRNPVGILKYHEEIKQYFRPNKHIMDSVTSYLMNIRAKSAKKVVGVHIRQGDYKTFKGGRYYVSPIRSREIMDQFLKENNFSADDVMFVIASNGSVDEKIFTGLNCDISHRSGPEDLFILAGCDLIIGSDSSFGNFAAYYGNITHIVSTNDQIDWNYYRGKSGYFQNKYCTLVHF